MCFYGLFIFLFRDLKVLYGNKLTSKRKRKKPEESDTEPSADEQPSVSIKFFLLKLPFLKFTIVALLIYRTRDEVDSAQHGLGFNFYTSLGAQAHSF